MLERYLFLVLSLAMATSRAMAASRKIYDEKADAVSDVHAAIREAGRHNKNVVVIFGANWCGDCRALDRQMHQRASPTYREGLCGGQGRRRSIR